MISTPFVFGEASNISPRELLRMRLIIFGGALAVALLSIFVLWQAQSLVAQANDIYRFADLGKNIAEGNGFRFSDTEPTIRRAPLYPGMIALLYTIFGESALAIQLMQALMAAGTCLLAFEIGRKLFNLRTGIIAGVVAALHPMVMRYVPDIQVETSLTFLYTLAIHRAVRLAEEGTLLNGFMLGLAAAASAMVKSVTLPFAALFMLAYLVFRRWQRTSSEPVFPGFGAIVAMGLAMGLVILPWTYRNYQITGMFVPISGNASGEFLRGYVFAQPRYFLLKDPPYVVGEEEANEMQRKLFREKGLVWERDEAETERVHSEALKEKLRESPGAFVKKVVIAAFMFWYVVTSKTSSLIVGGLALGAWVLAFYGMKHGHRKRDAFWLLLLPIFSLNLIYALVLALGRYSAPCIPALIVLAAFGADRLLRRVTSTGEAAPAS